MVLFYSWNTLHNQTLGMKNKVNGHDKENAHFPSTLSSLIKTVL